MKTSKKMKVGIWFLAIFTSLTLFVLLESYFKLRYIFSNKRIHSDIPIKNEEIEWGFPELP